MQGNGFFIVLLVIILTFTVKIENQRVRQYRHHPNV